MSDCRICGSSEHTLFSDQVSQAPGSSIYACAGCGVKFLDPIMNEEEEDRFYRQEFEGYMEKRSGSAWQTAGAHFREYQAEGERRLPLVAPYLKPEDEVLEIGSSTGYFLDDLRGYVASVTGLEPGEAFREFADGRGIETKADLEELGDRQFDVVLLYYVVEHLRDPVGYFEALKPRLKPGARVLIEVPNVDDALISLYDAPDFQPFYWQKAHYLNFTRDSLAFMFEKAGYQVDVKAVQRYDLSNHLVWLRDGKPGGAGRFAETLGSVVNSAYADALIRSWKCDTLFAIAQPAED